MGKDYDLDGSDRILVWPSGFVEEDVLECLLNDAISKGLKDDDCINCIKREQTCFDPEFPWWDNRRYTMTFSKLKNLYKRINNKDFLV